MDNIHEVSKHFLELIADADRQKNTELAIKIWGGRTIYFWDARHFARIIGIDDYELDQVVRFLSERGFLYWRHNYDDVKTVELTDKGFKWEYHRSLLEPKRSEQPMQNNVTLNFGPGASFTGLLQLDKPSTKPTMQRLEYKRIIFANSLKVW